MPKVFALISYHLGIWGFLGFFATLIIGFIACCTNISEAVYYILLAIFAAVGIAVSVVCTTRKCRNKN
ncbi:MAG TPA: hypothetical protein VKA10_00595 [Prolixibacteraceae bacterium]|nr:hypothetical protein [Prolixibacteraceae bacterium]